MGSVGHRKPGKSEPKRIRARGRRERTYTHIEAYSRRRLSRAGGSPLDELGIRFEALGDERALG